MVTVVTDHALAETAIERKESDGEEREEEEKKEEEVVKKSKPV